ncbi:MAG: T9SS type A sorting domain-containing protein, partial [Bacteroidales bacterium]|nr:T9SS type A sorting domain-containing protein [Bacteroidales bacterium]
TACEIYTWNGTTYTVSGNYTYNHADANGCTQVDTLHLTINNPVHTATSETACEIYTWNGTTYTVSGNYTYNHADANGCTQVDTLHLTINNPVHTATTEVACETYTWNGTAYTVSGNYTYSHADNNGCAQVDTLHLTINNPVHMATTEVACETYTWNGTAYTVSGSYTYSHADNNGCAQVDTLHLTINYSVVAYDSITIASTELPYDYHGNTIDAGGNYTFTGATTEGCDSTMHLNVIVNQDGIDDVSIDTEIRVYPNPTDGDVIVEGRGVERIEVMDVTGRVLINRRCEGAADCRIDISTFGQGAYLLRVTTVDGVAIRKVVKR